MESKVFKTSAVVKSPLTRQRRIDVWMEIMSRDFTQLFQHQCSEAQRGSACWIVAMSRSARGVEVNLFSITTLQHWTTESHLHRADLWGNGSYHCHLFYLSMCCSRKGLQAFMRVVNGKLFSILTVINSGSFVSPLMHFIYNLKPEGVNRAVQRKALFSLSFEWNMFLFYPLVHS